MNFMRCESAQKLRGGVLHPSGNCRLFGRVGERVSAHAYFGAQVVATGVFLKRLRRLSFVSCIALSRVK